MTDGYADKPPMQPRGDGRVPLLLKRDLRQCDSARMFKTVLLGGLLLAGPALAADAPALMGEPCGAVMAATPDQISREITAIISAIDTTVAIPNGQPPLLMVLDDDQMRDLGQFAMYVCRMHPERPFTVAVAEAYWIQQRLYAARQDLPIAAGRPGAAEEGHDGAHK